MTDFEPMNRDDIGDYLDEARLAVADASICGPDEETTIYRHYERAAALTAIAQAATLLLIEEHLSALAAWVNHTGPGN